MTQLDRLRSMTSDLEGQQSLESWMSNPVTVLALLVAREQFTRPVNSPEATRDPQVASSELHRISGADAVVSFLETICDVAAPRASQLPDPDYGAAGMDMSEV